MSEPGHYILRDEPVALNAGRPRTVLTVANTGDRPVQVGSHFHFFEANPALAFDRAAAFGQRLDIPAGTAVRFEPGDTRAVTLVPLGGAGRAIGFGGLVDGSVRAPGALARAMRRAAERGYTMTEPGGGTT
jgi:urease beta subunit